MYPMPPGPHDLNIGMMLGRLLHGQETTVSRLDRIDDRLACCDRTMQGLSQQVARLEKGRGRISRAERMTKQVLRWAIPTATLWWTGSIETALKVLQGLR